MEIYTRERYFDDTLVDMEFYLSDHFAVKRYVYLGHR